MKKRISLTIALTAIILTISLAILPMGTTFAAIADGTYDVSYEVKEAGSNSTSIADGYFVKPATLSVENGQNFITVMLTGSNYVQSLNGPNGATVLNEDKANKTITYKMQVGDLSQPVTMGMHITVPKEMMPPNGYDKQHTARAVFDISGLPSAGEEGTVTADTTTNEGTGEEVANPKTGDSTSIALYVTLILSSIIVFIVYRLRFARN